MRSIKLNPGDRFNLLTFVRDDGYDHSGRRAALFQCDCGNRVTITTTRVKCGGTKSCGCLNALVTRQIGHLRNLKHGHAKPGNHSPEYRVWKAMKVRCKAPTNKDFPRYGGRGIVVCDRWLNSFENFLSDMGPRPAGTSIDRINNDGNYEPGNCRWADPIEQSGNRRKSITVRFNGQDMNLRAASRLSGINYSTLVHRIKKQGISPEEALSHV